MTTDSTYIPHKIRSHPLRCLILPIFATLLFISYWFVLCPLVYVGLCKMKLGWTSNWHFYYWISTLLIFLIILAKLVFLWRKKCKYCSSHATAEKDPELTCKLITKDAKGGTLKNIEDQSKYIKKLEDRLDGDLDDGSAGKKAKVQVSAVTISEGDHPDVGVEPKTTKERPDNLNISTSTTEETHVDLHSPAGPLTPRQVFFWDLIQSANENDSVNFDLNKKPTSLVNATLASVIPKKWYERPRLRHHTVGGLRSRSTDREYFIANVPQRRSLTTEVYMYVDGGDDQKYLRIRMDDENVNCV